MSLFNWLYPKYVVIRTYGPQNWKQHVIFNLIKLLFNERISLKQEIRRLELDNKDLQGNLRHQTYRADSAQRLYLAAQLKTEYVNTIGKVLKESKEPAPSDPIFGMSDEEFKKQYSNKESQ